MKKIYVLLGWLLTIHAAGAQSFVSGYVYEDLNGNGLKDTPEKGIPRVAVSNSRDVVLTDAAGMYRLPVEQDNVIFVIKPTGYKVPVNGNNQPCFFYIHKPGGSPPLTFNGSPPTGPLPALVNFALIRIQETDNFSALLFGDPQVSTLEQVSYFEQGIVQELKGIKDVRFGLSLGDLVQDNLALNEPYLKAVGKIGIPWYNLMGNHDINYDAVADSLSDETFEAAMGPANYSFNSGKAHFIVLDNVLYPNPRTGKGFVGGFRSDQLAFIKNDLKFVPKDQLIVLAFHICLQLDGGRTFRENDRHALFDLLKGFPEVLVISGHTHLQRQNFYTQADGWPTAKPLHEYNAGTTSGDWYSGELNEMGIPVATMRDGTPKGYAFLNIRGNQYTIDYKVAGKPKDHQIAIFTPKVVPLHQATSAGIYANFFMGTKNDSVSYRVDDGPWKAMKFTEEADPGFMDLLHRWDVTDTLMPGYRPTNAVKSTHLWRGEFPVDLPAGRHCIEVKARDLFNRLFTERRYYLIQQNK